MKITKEEILKKFSKEEMAQLLVGATEITNILRDLAKSQMEQIKQLEDKIFEMKKIKKKFKAMKK